ncbi:helix-turn-helix transcriptional regulator [Bifidobacterium stellenboschense]|uniref:HTH cro/C1-type domain-containing protein n=1 Tax=Bifidobacterium stellenboschense TaxID=762211 RepID=A0A087DPR4_9BIFI|nr:helix-turn-helix domain-containing protein [Bifidobacterium stellenboschense]KFI97514.1 hypothetical protein BSTEL_0235 [Bifidobacterium stellenboschense]
MSRIKATMGTPLMRTVLVDGPQLRRIRLDARLTMKTIAEMIGVQESTVSRIERGEHPIESIGDDKTAQWAEILGINPARMPRRETRPDPDNILVRMSHERGWTVKDLGEQAGVNPSSLQRYWYEDSPVTSMTAGYLYAIARVLGTSMERLAGRPEPDPGAVPEPPEDWDGEPLRWYRGQAGLPQVNLAVKSGQPQNVISGIETGRRSTGRVRAGTLLDLAAALGVPAERLIAGAAPLVHTPRDPRPDPEETGAESDAGTLDDDEAFRLFREGVEAHRAAGADPRPEDAETLWERWLARHDRQVLEGRQSA